MSLAENRFIFASGKQSVKGTPVAATSYPRWGDGTIVNPDLKTERIREGDGTATIGRIIKNLQFYKGKLVHAKARSIDLGFYLKAVMGTGSDVISGAGPYVHTFTPKLIRDYYTVYGQWLLGTPESIKVADAQFHSMSLAGSSGKILDVSYDFAGLTGVDDTTALTAAYDASTAPYHYTNGVFSVDGSTVGQVAPYVRKFKIDYKHALDDTMQTEAITLADFVSTVREIDVEFEVLWQDFTQFKKVYWNAGSADSGVAGVGALSLTFYPGGDTAQTSTLVLSVANLGYESALLPDPKLSGKAFLQTVKGVATVSSEFGAVLTNTQSTAY